MNSAHLHLILNHLPFAFCAFGSAALAWGIWNKQAVLVRFGLWVLVAGGAIAAATYLTGQPAEDYLGDLNVKLEEKYIGPHEQAGGIGFAISVMTALGAAAALFGFQTALENASGNRWLLLGTCGLGILAALVFAYTGLLGGQLMHTEIR